MPWGCLLSLMRNYVDLMEGSNTFTDFGVSGKVRIRYNIFRRKINLRSRTNHAHFMVHIPWFQKGV